MREGHVTTPSRDEVIDDVRAWLDVYWDDQLPLLEWRNRLVNAGWGCPSWPVRWKKRWA